MSGGGASLLFLLNADDKPDALALDLYDSTIQDAEFTAKWSAGVAPATAALGAISPPRWSARLRTAR
jgi:hypothetical protein